MLCLVLAVMSFALLGTLEGKLILAAALLYFIGCDGVTMLFNVRLNNALAATPSGTPEATDLWARFPTEWTFWNHVRTAASFVSAIMFTSAGILALIN